MRRIIWAVLLLALPASVYASPPPGGEATAVGITPAGANDQPASTIEPPFYTRWTRAIAPSSTLVAAGRVYVAVGSPPHGSLEALDIATGAMLWTTPLTGTALAYDGGRLYVAEAVSPFLTTAYDAATGTSLWSIPDGGPIVAQANVLYVANGTLNAYDGGTGAALWSTSTTDVRSVPALTPTAAFLPGCSGIISIPLATGVGLSTCQFANAFPDSYSDGRVVVDDGFHSLATVVDAGTGATVSTFNSGVSPPAVARGIAVTLAAENGTAGTNLVAVNVATGKRRWATFIPGYLVGAPVIAGDLVLVAASAADQRTPGTLWALDLATGRVRGKHAIGVYALSVTPAEGAVLVSGSDLTALDTTFRREPQTLTAQAFAPAASSKWEAWSEVRTGAVAGIFRQRSTGALARIDGRTVGVYVGGIDGDQIVYQRVDRDGRHDAIVVRDAVRGTKKRLGRRINDGAWLWRPTKSGKYVLYAHGEGTKTHSVLLANTSKRKPKTLDKGNPKRRYVAPGQVSGNYAVWTVCAIRQWCVVKRRTISTGRTTTVGVRGVDLFDPAVTSSGVVYAAAAGRESKCPRERVVRWRGAAVESLYATPANSYIGRLYSADVGNGYVDVRYEVTACQGATYSIGGVIDRPSLAGMKLTVPGAAQPPALRSRYAAPPGSVTIMRHPLG